MKLPKTFGELEKKFGKIAKKSPREAAEAAYALAAHFFSAGNPDKGRTFAQKAIKLFKKCGTETREACVAIHDFICGIAIPDEIHEQLIQYRLDNFWGQKKTAV